MITKVFIMIIIVLIAVIIEITAFAKLSRKKKIANIKEWLKLAVVEAEKTLGEGTGQLKLRYVYNQAVAYFPWIASLVSFETFSAWVDEALEWMEKQLEQNQAITNYINQN